MHHTISLIHVFVLNALIKSVHALQAFLFEYYFCNIISASLYLITRNLSCNYLVYKYINFIVVSRNVTNNVVEQFSNV